MNKNIFNLESKYSLSYEQKKLVEELSSYLESWNKFSTLWWITGSGKTFTMANIIAKMQKPSLIIAHNKTLAAQLAQEFKEFFPNNAVHYFVSYYDYYQPEAYVSKTDTYIEKESSINAEIDRLRHAATQDLLTRKDVIIVASVSCIYGIWNLESYTKQIFYIEVWKTYNLENILKSLVNMQYKRSYIDFKQWMFQLLWDTLDIYPSSSENIYTIEFWWEEVTNIFEKHNLTWEIYNKLDKLRVFPASHTVSTKEDIEKIIPYIKEELEQRLAYFKNDLWDILKYERLKTKIEYDMEMMLEVWYVNWIENYSRFLDGRQKWEAPTSLINYFPKDFLTFVDESHMTFPQIWWMYAGDRARKLNLVENAFRLESALDNRPLQFDEFEKITNKIIAVSATPWEYEIKKSSNNPEYFFNFDPKKDGTWISSIDNRIVSQIIRPTWLLDPCIELRAMDYMTDDIMKNISYIQENNERMLITTITKRASEELTDYLLENWVKVKYLHSEIETLERLETLKELREWKIDVIVWVNLLREGLDLPEVSKICILDADKQGFLRSTTSLIQIIWRAARNSNWIVYMYSEQAKWFKIEKRNWSNCMIIKDKIFEEEEEFLFRFDKWKLINKDGLFISGAMKKAIDLTYYRRWLQEKYNNENNIIAKTVFSSIKDIWIRLNKIKVDDYIRLDQKELNKKIKKLELEMDIASANMDYEKAIEIRDLLLELKKKKKI